mgnify:CR=1 FL=1
MPWHVSNALINYSLRRNMPKACPYVMMRRVRQITDIQYSITIMGGREVSHPYQNIGFSPKASGFYPFGDATDLVRGRRW